MLLQNENKFVFLQTLETKLCFLHKRLNQTLHLRNISEKDFTGRGNGFKVKLGFCKNDRNQTMFFTRISKLMFVFTNILLLNMGCRRMISPALS